MRLTVIGSSSEGNAYVLQSAGEALLLEAGLPFGKVLRAIGYELGKVAGCRDTLLANDLSGVSNIVLLHLSGDHADPAECREPRRPTPPSSPPSPPRMPDSPRPWRTA